jgi:hypothetical protein
MLERDFASFAAVGDDHETYFTARPGTPQWL